MSAPRVPVTFAPEGLTVWVVAGTTVVEAARAAGIIIPTPCGGRGTCGACGVRVRSGALSEPNADEQAALAHAPQGVRLACRARVVGPVEVKPLVAGSRIVARASGEAGELRPVVAGVDLGTTSVAAVIIDLRSGSELARVSVPNLQQRAGADVLSRISAALAGGAEELRMLAEESIVNALSLAAQHAGVRLAGVSRVVIAGNTAMAALLCGVDPTSLSVHPFRAPALPTVVDSVALRAALSANAEVLLVPAMASFVGGDALAGVLYSRMLDTAAPVLLVDLGTNAEIVLSRGGVLHTTSAAAGPAFEGAGIACGGPAADGAVSLVAVTEEGACDLTVLGGGQPEWFSGSGVVSAMSALLRLGHIDATGLMHRDGVLEDRYAVDDSGIAGFAFGVGSGCLRITQLDVRAVQLAKAAIHVGIESVLRTAGCTASELTQVRVAGAFGFSVQPADLVALGVLPAESARVALRVGNTSLEGAAAIALDPGLLVRAEVAVAAAVSVELAGVAGFNEAFLSAMELAPYSL